MLEHLVCIWGSSLLTHLENKMTGSGHESCRHLQIVCQVDLHFSKGPPLTGPWTFLQVLANNDNKKKKKKTLSVFAVALGSPLHPQLMDRVERDRERQREREGGSSLCGAHYTVDFVMVPCWMASTPSHPCPDATREISGLYRTGLSGIPYIHPESVDSRTQIGF